MTTAEDFLDSYELMMDAVENNARGAATRNLDDMMYFKDVLEGDIMDFVDKRDYQVSLIIEGE